MVATVDGPAPLNCGFCGKELDADNGGVCGNSANVYWDCLALLMPIFHNSRPAQFNQAVKAAKDGSFQRALKVGAGAAQFDASRSVVAAPAATGGDATRPVD